MINIYIASLGKYNEGELVGDWVKLPMDMEWFNDVFLPSIQIDGQEYEEYATHDYETDIEGLRIGEYSNISELNELAETLESLDKHDKKKLEALIEWGVYDINSYAEAIENLDNYTLLEDVDTEEKLGNYWLIESGCYEIPDYLLSYLDTEAFGRDMAINGDGYFSRHGWIYE